MVKEMAREQAIQRKENLLILGDGAQLRFFADFLYYSSSCREENFINMGGGRWGVGSKPRLLVNELKKRVRTPHSARAHTAAKSWKYCTD